MNFAFGTILIHRIQISQSQYELSLENVLSISLKAIWSKSSSYPPNLELKEAKQHINHWLGGDSHFIARRREGVLKRVKFVSRDI